MIGWKRKWVGSLVLAFAGTGCAASVEPEPVDTSTSWLSACARDGDCAMGHCIAGMCTLACDPGGNASECGAIAARAECTDAPGGPRGLCALACDHDRDCEAVGPGLVCIDGQCRGEPPRLVVSELALSDAMTTHEVPHTSPSSSGALAWTGDDWRLARVHVADADAEEMRVTVLDVAPDGVTEERDFHAPPMEVGSIDPDGDVVLIDPSQSVRAEAGSFESELGWRYDATDLGGAEPVRVARHWTPLPDSDDVLVFEPGPIDIGGYALGRYSPAEERWIWPRRRVLEAGKGGAPWISVLGNDVVLGDELPASVANLPLWILPEGASSVSAPEPRAAEVDSADAAAGEPDVWYLVDGGVLRGAVGEGGPWPHPEERYRPRLRFLRGRKVGSPVEFVVGEDERTRVLWSGRRGQRVMFVYGVLAGDPARETLMARAFDLQGTPLTPPEAIGALAGAGRATLQGAAWSDAAVLVWWVEQEAAKAKDNHLHIVAVP